MRVSDIISNVAEVQQSKPLPTLPIMGVPERSLYYTCRKAVMERHSIYKYALERYVCNHVLAGKYLVSGVSC